MWIAYFYDSTITSVTRNPTEKVRVAVTALKIE
jgi:hypothetical protein